MEDYKKNKPLVSILIPLYNAEDYIEETIYRLKKQTYNNIEIIVVDDHSTDTSLIKAQKFESNIIHIYTNPKKGGNSARNYAFSKCSGEYVKFMDADDFCSDNMIEEQVNILLNYDKRAIVFSPISFYYTETKLTQSIERNIDKKYTPGIELLIDIWKGKGWNGVHCYMMNRFLVEEAGGWNENIKKNQDGEFFARILSKSTVAVPSLNAIAYWRQTGSGVSSQLFLPAQESMLKTYDIISHLILNYKDNEENRYNCAKYIGSFVYRFYPQIEPIMPKVYEILDYLQQPLILPKRKVLRLLRFFLGWKIALRLINKYNL